MQPLNSQKKNKIGVGLAGLGFGEKVHLQALKHNKLLNPIALWHPRKQRLDDACKKHTLLGFAQWSDLLEPWQVEGE